MAGSTHQKRVKRHSGIDGDGETRRAISIPSWPHQLSILQPFPIRISELSLHWDSFIDPPQQNQTFCRPGGIHAPGLTWLERCFRHHRSRDPTRSTSLDVWCWWNCSELALVLSNPVVPICEGQYVPEHHFIRLTLNWCPTGFCTWPDPFHFFYLPIQLVAANFKVDQQQYADDTQLFILISKTNSVDQIHCLKATLLQLTSWFYYNCLALNPEKSEVILLSTHARNKSLSNINQVGRYCWHSYPLIWQNQSTWHNHRLNSQFQQTCQSYLPILPVSHLCTPPHQTDPRRSNSSFGLTCFSKLVARLCQLNSVWPKSHIAKLQSQQNVLAHVVMRASIGSARPLLHELH